MKIVIPLVEKIKNICVRSSERKNTKVLLKACNNDMERKAVKKISRYNRRHAS